MIREVSDLFGSALLLAGLAAIVAVAFIYASCLVMGWIFPAPPLILEMA